MLGGRACLHTRSPRNSAIDLSGLATSQSLWAVVVVVLGVPKAVRSPRASCSCREPLALLKTYRGPNTHKKDDVSMQEKLPQMTSHLFET